MLVKKSLTRMLVEEGFYVEIHPLHLVVKERQGSDEILRVGKSVNKITYPENVNPNPESVTRALSVIEGYRKLRKNRKLFYLLEV